MRQYHTIKLSRQYRKEHPNVPEGIDYSFFAPVPQSNRGLLEFRIKDCFHQTLVNIQAADWLSKNDKNKFIGDLKRDTRSYRGPLPVTIGDQTKLSSISFLLDGKKLSSPVVVGIAGSLVAGYTLPTENMFIQMGSSIGAGMIAGLLTYGFNRVTNFLKTKAGLYGFGDSVNSARKNLAADVLGAGLSLAMTFGTIATGLDSILCRSDNINTASASDTAACQFIAPYSLRP